MRYASGDPERDGFTCGSCGRTVTTAIAGLFANPKPGSPARFCDSACRQAAYRRRRAGVAENAPLQHRGGRGRSLRSRPDETGRA
ncbi:MAG: hypothetical protein M3011_01070 [Actinomycetota bacterium]|nr:hypothetical protein [Actinomycetota bacterium]